MDTKIQKEKEFHDMRFGGSDPRAVLGKFYSVKEHANQFFKKLIIAKCRGKKLLEYGCGFGNTSSDYLSEGAVLTGIDISEEGIKRAKKSVMESDFQADYLVMNAEEMTFENDVFDVCIGSGILHHLDLDKSVADIARVLKKNGTAIFIEPMGHNPIINWYRNRTPSLRTDDEHPLLLTDFQCMEEHFHKVSVNYFALTTLLAVPLLNTPVFNIFYKLLQRLDKVLFKIPFIGRNAWAVVIEMSDPIN